MYENIHAILDTDTVADLFSWLSMMVWDDSYPTMQNQNAFIKRIYLEKWNSI